MSEIKNPTKDYSRFSVIALLAASFIMGYIDIIGAAIGYVQIDFSLTETLTKLIPTSVFILSPHQQGRLIPNRQL